MKLVEEKKSLFVQLVSLIFIILSGIAIQYCDGKIFDHNNEILKQALEVNRIESERISQKLKSVRYLIFALAPGTITIDEESYSSQSNISDFIPIVENYKNGKIDKKEYGNQMSVAHNRRSLRIAKKYIAQLAELRKKIATGTKWTAAKHILFAIQLIAVCTAAFMYRHLLISIGQRTKKKDS